MGDLTVMSDTQLRPQYESRLPINKLIFASSVQCWLGAASPLLRTHNISQVSAVTSLIHLYQWAGDNRAEYQ